MYSTNLRACDVRALERAYSACVRFVYGLRHYDSTREYIDKVLGCPIMTYIKHRKCSIVYSLSKSRMPAYLYEKLRRGNSLRNDIFFLPRHSSTQYNKSFFVRAVSDYNSLPVEIKRLNSVHKFSKACIEYLKSR